MDLKPIKKDIKFIINFMRKNLDEDKYIKFNLKDICFNGPEYVELVWDYGDIIYVDKQILFDDIVLNESHDLEYFLEEKTTHAINLAKNKYNIINQIRKVKNK
jgi:hypothetical protein